jgi:hypothetical protein
MHYGAVAGRIRMNSLISDLCEGVESMNERSVPVGCTTVIASPWPIDSRIPSHWLPAFLEAWDAGVPVIDALFEANARVRDHFSAEFRDCLAMSIYGDPLRTKVR